MIVVSDTSPILNLSIVGRLELLQSLFGQIVLPPWVAAELGRHRIEVEASWMRVVAAQDRVQLAELRKQLDPGEAEAIIVALELQASLILIDEHAAVALRRIGVWNTWGCSACYRKRRSAVSHPNASRYLTR